MRLIPLILVAVTVATPAPAQDWKTVTVIEDGFRSNYPGDPAVESISYDTEFRLSLPGRVYRAADDLGRYSTTVVDYRDAERLHGERSAKCLTAHGANQQDGDTCQNDFVMEVAGARVQVEPHTHRIGYQARPLRTWRLKDATIATP